MTWLGHTAKPSGPGIETFNTNVNAQDIYVTCHPARSSAGTSVGYVLCPAFGEEGECARRTFHEMACTLADDGVSVTVVDLPGTGNSSGDMTSVQLRHWVDALVWCAQDLHQRGGVREVGLLGLRLGCITGLLALPQLPVPAGLVLWDPPLYPERHVHALLRCQVVRAAFTNGRAGKSRAQRMDDARATGVLDFDGYLISTRLIDEIGGLRWDTVPASTHAGLPVAVTMFDRPARLPDIAAQLARVCPQASIETLALTHEVPRFWKRMDVSRADELIARTRQWICGCDAEPSATAAHASETPG